jgi:ATP-binding cassette, subfamily C, type I secretion system permease/ATPase
MSQYATEPSSLEGNAPAPGAACEPVRSFAGRLTSGVQDRLTRIGFLFGETVRLWSGSAPALPAAQAEAVESEDIPGTENPLNDWRTLARRTFVHVAAFSVVVNLLMLTVPIYLFQLSDRVLTSRSLDTLFMLSLLALVFLTVLAVLDVCRRQVLSGLATRLETILGGHLLASVVNAPTNMSGGASETLRSLHRVRNFLSSQTMLLLFDAPLAPLYFAVVFLINPILGTIALAAGILLIGIAVLNQRTTSAPLGQAGLHATNADERAEALARNAQVINAMGMLHEGVRHWGREHSRALSVQGDALSRNFWISGTSKYFRLVTQILVLGCGAYLALLGEITGGMMIAASIIASRALQPFEGMIEGWRNVVQAHAAYKRIIASIEAFTRAPPRLRLPAPKGKLTADRLLSIPAGCKEPVLNGVSFELEPGMSLAIVGPSGSGKSTLARLLVGCQPPTSGHVRLDGTELCNWDRRQFGLHTGYLPQEVELFPGTIKENVCRMRRDLPDEKIYEAAVNAGVHEMITRLPNGYETVLQEGGAPLSGGQKQRIALARALFGDPSLIVLDEPNSNLDATGEKALNESLQQAKRRGVTVVAITQRPALLNSVDRVLVLCNGRMEAYGPPSQVLHRVVPAKQTSEPQAAPPRERRA